MEITVVRQTGVVGMAMKMAIYIDGEKVGDLGNNETQVFLIEKREVSVQAGQSFIKTKPIVVAEGQTVLAKSSLLGNLFSIFGRSSFYLEIAD